MTDSAPIKRGPGRPKGYAKTGGRRPNVPPKTSVELRERILKRADPPGFLIRVALGHKIKHDGKFIRPTWDQRCRAQELLIRKVCPDVTTVAATVDATIDAHLTTEDIAGMSPVEKEQRLLAIGSALGNLRAVLDPPLAAAPPAAADAGPVTDSRNGAASPGAAPTGGNGLFRDGRTRADLETPPERAAGVAIIKASMAQDGQAQTVAELEAQAAVAAAQAGDADPDDPASVEAARYRFETVSARKPERPQFWSDRLARSRRGADGN